MEGDFEKFADGGSPQYQRKRGSTAIKKYIVSVAYRNRSHGVSLHFLLGRYAGKPCSVGMEGEGLFLQKRNKKPIKKGRENKKSVAME